MVTKYLLWRRGLSGRALFAVAFLEFPAFVLAWLLAVLLFGTILAAPYVWGLWGVGLWLTIISAALAWQQVMGRKNT